VLSVQLLFTDLQHFPCCHVDTLAANRAISAEPDSKYGIDQHWWCCALFATNSLYACIFNYTIYIYCI